MDRTFRLRPARESDLPILVVHRHGMFSEIGHRTEDQIRRHDARYRRWARERLRSGELAGVVAEDRKGTVVGSGCVWFREEQPRPETALMRSAYILSMYTEPAFRRRGAASAIVRRLLAIIRQRGYGRASLHASVWGRELYESVGFEPTNEMRLILDPHSRGSPKSRSASTAAARPRVRRARRGLRPGPAPAARRARTTRVG